LAQGRGTPPPPGYYAGRDENPSHQPIAVGDPGWAEPKRVTSPTPPPTPASAPSVPADERITQAYKTIQDVGESFEKHRQDIEAQRGQLKPEAMRPMIESYVNRPEVKAKFDQAVQQVEDVLTEAQTEEKIIRTALVPPRDTAGEIRAQRIWARQQQLLDSAGNESQRVAMAREIVWETTDFADFATAVEELAPYLKSHGQPTDWLENEIAQRIPALAEAKQNVSKAERQLMRARADADMQKRALAKGHKAGHLVGPEK
jgi:chromosome segregation ATPase